MGGSSSGRATPLAWSASGASPPGGNGRVQGLNKDADPFDPEENRRVRTVYERNLRYIQVNFGWDYAERIYINNKEWLGLSEKMAVHNLEWVTEGALEFMDRYHRQPFFLHHRSRSPTKSTGQG